jgi:eukaryotic-like serine/threonine-protein kinase
MPIAFKDFWKLALDSHLLSLDECKRLNSAFARVKGADQGNSVTLAEWLVTSGVISRYQANVLLTGKPRPFVFGEFKVHDRYDAGRLKGLYRAVHQPTGHPVALFFVSRTLAQDAQHLAQFERQAHAATAVRDEHLSRVFEFVNLNSVKFVVGDDLQGTSLADYLATARVAPADACRIVRDLSLAAAALDAAGQSHGDIRPANVWLTSTGGVKLLGFPLAREPGEPAAYRANAAEPSARLSAQADYLAPELAHPRRSPDRVSDIYSLGCMLYELLTGQAPFAGGDVAEKLARHAAEPAVSLDRFGMPAALAQLVAQMMAKNPPVRLASAAQAAAGLAPFASPEPAAAQGETRSLAAYEQVVAQRPPVAEPMPNGSAASSAAAATAGVSESPFPGAADAPGNGDRAGGSAPAFAGMQGVAVATRPTTKAGADLRQITAAPPRTKRKKISPMAVMLGVFGVFTLGAIIAGLAMQSGEAPPKPTAPHEETLAVVVDTPDHASAPHKKKTKKKLRPAQVAADPEAEPEQQPPADVDDDETERVATAKPSRRPPPRVRPPEKPAVKEIEDDGETLWISPTSGAPVRFDYLPGGAQLFLIVRPADILNSAEGAKAVAGLGPVGQLAVGEIRSITGVDAAQVEQLLVGFYPSETGVRAAFVARLTTEVPEEQVLASWKQPTAAEHNGKKYFKNATTAYYLPAESSGRVIAIMPAAEVEETLDTDGPPSLRKEMEKLLVDSDDQRHFTVMFAPFGLFTDERTLFVGELERLQKPLDRFLGDRVQAALFSFHLGNDFFLEMRAYGEAEEDPFQLATRYRTQLAKAPEEVDDYINTLPLQPYSRAILRRFPDMIRLVENYTRLGDEHRQAVLRCYLPQSAGHNLIMGTELTLLEKPGAAAAVVAKTVASKKAATPAEALKQKISISFPRDTLEKCMEMLGKEIDSEVVILGSDLQLDGITKNQSFALDERDKPAEEILRTVLKLANSDGKLVYVIKPKDGGKDAIFITTRAAAAKRGDTLPPELVAVDPPKGK